MMKTTNRAFALLLASLLLFAAFMLPAGAEDGDDRPPLTVRVILDDTDESSVAVYLRNSVTDEILVARTNNGNVLLENLGETWRCVVYAYYSGIETSRGNWVSLDLSDDSVFYNEGRYVPAYIRLSVDETKYEPLPRPPVSLIVVANEAESAGDRYEGVTVIIQNENNGTKLEKKTGADGKARFENLGESWRCGVYAYYGGAEDKRSDWKYKDLSDESNFYKYDRKKLDSTDDDPTGGFFGENVYILRTDEHGKPVYGHAEIYLSVDEDTSTDLSRSGLWENIKGFFSDLLAPVVFLAGLPGKIMYFFTDLREVVNTAYEGVLTDGGRMYYTAAMQETVSKLYNIFYPFGVAILIISWAFGVCSSGLSLNLEPSNRNSILRAILQLIIGLWYLASAPQIMMVIWSMSTSVCARIGSAFTRDPSWMTDFWFWIVVLILNIIIMLNFAKCALLQCISPLFSGFAAGGEGARRMAVGFLKEFARCCLIPPVTIAYFYLCQPLYDSAIGLISTIAIGVSLFGIGKKTLDRLLN